METLPVEIILQNILKLQHSDIKNICSTNQRIRSICKSNEDYIYKKLLERDYGSWTKSPKEIYKLLNDKVNLLDFDVHNDEDEFHFINELAHLNRFKQLHFLHKLHIINIYIRNEDGDNILLNYVNDINMIQDFPQDSSEEFIKIFQKIINLGIDINTSDYYDNTVLDNILDYISSDMLEHQTTILTQLVEILIIYNVKVRKSNITTAENNNLPRDLINKLKQCPVLQENPEYDPEAYERSIDSRASSFSQSWDGY